MTRPDLSVCVFARGLGGAAGAAADVATSPHAAAELAENCTGLPLPR
ncbi:hypothetical protein ACWCXB_30675 [Streptomyces sp. NPDC001514]